MRLNVYGIYVDIITYFEFLSVSRYFVNNLDTTSNFVWI